MNKLQLKTQFITKDYKEFLLSKDFLKDVSISVKQNLDIVIYDDQIENDKTVLKISGPLEKISLIVFRIKQLISFSSLVSTNSLRMRKEASNFKILFEFGLRRAQGPSGAVMASNASFLTSFDGVSNVLTGFKTGSQLNGTCAHSFIMSYQGKKSPILNETLSNKENYSLLNSLYEKCLEIRDKLKYNTNLSELSAFIAFSSIYKDNSILLADTYNVYQSGLKNTIIIALAMEQLGHKIKGVRLDSGDMVKQSVEGKKLFNEISNLHKIEWISNLKVGASNDINEKTLKEFNSRNHQIDVFGIGTNLVTCQSDPYMRLKTLYLTKSSFIDETNYDKVINKITIADIKKEYSNILKNKNEFFARYSLVESLLK